MTYECSPDLDSTRDLTVDALRLFQRFRQNVDRKTVSRLLDEEVAKHVRLCELAIMAAANGEIWWCVLPEHPLYNINFYAHEHLAEMGFKIDHRTEASEQVVPREGNGDETVKVLTVESRTIASWGLGKALDIKALSAEWRRREALEDLEASKNPPKCQLLNGAGDGKGREVVWSATLDEEYIVEVQMRYHRPFLCLFDLEGKFLHSEQTDVSTGAAFGLVVEDAEVWRERGQHIVDAWRAAGK